LLIILDNKKLNLKTMLEQSDIPLKQKQGSIFNPGEQKNDANYNQKIRKVIIYLFIKIKIRLNSIEEFQ